MKTTKSFSIKKYKRKWLTWCHCCWHGTRNTSLHSLQHSIYTLSF
jgi:hypothetical protein